MLHAAQQQVLFITDDIGVTVRSGPTSRFRVVGKLQAGTPIQVIAVDEENGTSQIKAQDDTTGWIKSEYISDQKTVKVLYQEALQENSTLRQNINRLEQQVTDQNNIVTLNDQLQQQVSELQNEADNLRQQNSILKDRFHSDIFYAGALVLLAGMLLSWLFASMSFKRRQRSGWR